MQQAETKPITTIDTRQREFSVSIFRDKNNRFLVRKSEIIHDITVPLYKTYALDLIDAVKIQDFLFQEIHHFKLN